MVAFINFTSLSRFNTALTEPLDPSDPSTRLVRLSREEIDNPHKEKTWKVFRENFRVEVKLKVIEHE